MRLHFAYPLLAVCALMLGGCSTNKTNKTDETDDGAASDRQYQTFTVSDVTFKMIRVEPGTFQMGNGGDEEPVHSVTLSSYYIGETEVTNALWQAVMGSKPTEQMNDGNDYPVACVSYEDITKSGGFLDKLIAATGQHFRLPTEAEWEFAARGGTKSQDYIYSGSHTIDEVAWYDNSSTPHPVGQKKANELGLYDMSGNVWEWCADWYGSYSSSAVTDPTGPTTGSFRVKRGGSWFNDAEYCRVGFRFNNGPSHRDYSLGLRLAL